MQNCFILNVEISSTYMHVISTLGANVKLTIYFIESLFRMSDNNCMLHMKLIEIESRWKSRDI